MFYYFEYASNGRMISKYESEEKIKGANIIAVERAEYDATSVENMQRLFDLKKMLADTDYVACKIAEGAATREEYADVLEQRRQARVEINNYL